MTYGIDGRRKTAKGRKKALTPYEMLFADKSPVGRFTSAICRKYRLPTTLSAVCRLTFAVLTSAFCRKEITP